jgi:hypothetical protein
VHHGVGLLSPRAHGTVQVVQQVDCFNRMLDTITTEVLVQRPGGVVVLNNLVHHSGFIGYLPGTKDEDKCGGIFGDVIVRAGNKIDSLSSLPRVRQDCGEARKMRGWRSLLSAYCVMNEDMWDKRRVRRDQGQLYCVAGFAE